MSHETKRGPLAGFRLRTLAVFAAALVAAPTLAQQGAVDEPLSQPVPIGQDAGAPVPTIPVQAVREEATDLDEIEVTGSRIRGVDLEKSQPVVVMSRADIERAGFTSLGEALSRLSVAGSALNTNVNNGGSGSTYVDLRSLGPQRTLVLVNGRRWVNDAGGFTNAVDFTTIPTSIVERIEVLKDGASALYGSDAIAGVINVITRKDFSGMQLQSQVGEFIEGDGRIQNHSLTVGTVGGKTSAYVDLSYRKAEPVFAGDREISSVPAYGVPANDTRVGASSTNPYGRYRGLADNGASSDDVTLIRTEDGGEPTDFRDFNPMGDGYNFQPVNYLATPSERTGFFGLVRHELFDFVTFQAEALYQNRKSSQVLAETPLTLGPRFGNNVVVAANAVYNPFDTAIGDDTTESVQRRLVEAGGRIFEQDVNTYHLGSGLNGNFEMMGRVLDWDVGYIFNQSVNQATTNGQVNLNRVQQAVGDPANCTGTESPDPCVPLNLFGPPGSITPEMLSFILVTEQSRLEHEVRGYTANLSTAELFQLPYGPLGVAVGFEHRREAGSDTPDALVNSGATSGSARKPTRGSFSLQELYAETRAALLRELPFVDTLDLTLATRYSEYDIQGQTRDVIKSKAGLEYRPYADLLLRVSFAEGFRAPSITELFGGRGDSFPQLVDPCSDFRNAEAPQDQATIDNCIAQGVPDANPGDPNYYTQSNSQIRTTVGGEPTLEPEESESLIWGAVYSPEFVQGLTVTADIYNYKLDNAIAALDAQGILDGCAATNSPFYCGQITRDPTTGDVVGLIATNTNLGGAEVSGVDLRTEYNLPPLFDGRYGDFGLDFSLTYLASYDQFVLDPSTGGMRAQQLEGRVTGDIVTIGGTSLPEFKWNLGLDWTYGQFGGTYTMRYIGEMVENCQTLAQAPEYEEAYCRQGFNQNGEPQSQHDVESILYHDIQFTWSLPQYSADLAFGVNNLLDQDPPVSYSVFANSFDARTYDLPGAFPYLRATVNFE